MLSIANDAKDLHIKDRTVAYQQIIEELHQRVGLHSWPPAAEGVDELRAEIDMLKGMLSMAHDEQATQIVIITEAKQQIIDELRAEIDKLQHKPLDVHDTIAGNKSWPFNTPELATADTMVDTDEDHSATDNALFCDISDEAMAGQVPFPEPGDAGYVDYARQQYEPLPHRERRRRQRPQALRSASELLQESALEAEEHINPVVTQLVSLSSDLLFSTQMLQPVPEDAAEPEEALLLVDALPLVNGLDVDDVALGSPVSALYALVPDSLGTAPLEEPVPPAEEDENMLSMDDFLATLQPEVSDPASPLVPRGIEPGDNVITNFTESHPLVGTWDHGDENEDSFTIHECNRRLRIYLRGTFAQLDAIATGVWIADMGLSGSGAVQIDGMGLTLNSVSSSGSGFLKMASTSATQHYVGMHDTIYGLWIRVQRVHLFISSTFRRPWSGGEVTTPYTCFAGASASGGHSGTVVHTCLYVCTCKRSDLCLLTPAVKLAGCFRHLALAFHCLKCDT